MSENNKGAEAPLHPNGNEPGNRLVHRRRRRCARAWCGGRRRGRRSATLDPGEFLAVQLLGHRVAVIHPVAVHDHVVHRTMLRRAW